MSVSFEQYKALRSQGLSDEQIDRFEAGDVPQSKPNTISPLRIAAETATDPILKPFGFDSQSRKAQELYGKGREAILASDAPIVGAGAREWASDKGPTLPVIGKVSPRRAVKEVQGLGLDTAMGLGTDALVAKGPSIVSKGLLKPLAKTAEEVGSRAVNFYIKPLQKSFTFGRNPGLGVIRNIGMQPNRESLANAVDEKLNTLTQSLEEKIKNNTGLVDIEPVRQHFKSILTRMADFPESYSNQIEAHGSFARDIDTFLRKNGAVSRNGQLLVSPDVALRLKRAIGKLPSWNVQDPKLGSLVKTGRETYWALDEALDTAIGPEHAQTNADISNLIGAAQGLEHGTAREQRKWPIGLMEMLAGGFVGRGNIFSPEALATAGAIKTMRSAPFNTGLGAVSEGIAKTGRNVGTALEKLERPSLAGEIFRLLKGNPTSETGVRVIPQPPKRTFPQEPNLIERNRMSEVSRALPDAVSTGKPPIRVEGSSTIELPELLESDFARLQGEYGIPTYGSGPRSSTSEFPKVPRQSLSKELLDALRRRAKYPRRGGVE